MARDRIAVIIDKEFGDRMRALSDTSYLWVIHSTENKRVVDDLWEKLDPADLHAMAVTIGSPDHEQADLPTQIEYMLDAAIEHFPDVARIQMFGTPANLIAFCDAAFLDRAFIRDDAVASELSYLRL